MPFYLILFQSLILPNKGILKFQDALNENNADFLWMENIAKNNPDDYCKFTGSGYHISVSRNGSGSLGHFCIAQKPDFSNFAFTIEMTILNAPSAGDDSGGGIIFRGNLNGPGPAYIFYISQNGWGALSILSSPGEGVRPPLIQHEVPGFYNGEQTYFIEVVALGEQIQIYVNNQLFTNISDLSSDHGKIGVFAQSAAGQIEVLFNSIQVWTL